MHTIEMLRQLVAYNRWAGRLIIESLKQKPNADPQAVRALVHLLVAEREWLMRLTQGKDNSGYNFWPEMSLAECESLMREVHSAYDKLLSNLTEEKLDDVATYKNSQGVEYRTKCRDILFHVMFHSTYHRGQVAMAERFAGNTPAYTDYIAFVRAQDRENDA